MSAKQSKAPAKIKDEIATLARDIDLFGGWLERLDNPDPTLRSEAAGQGLRLYDEISRDAHAGAVLQTRYLAVVGKEWEVYPASESAQDVEIANFVTECLKRVNFDQFRQELLEGILYGFYAAEVMWGAGPGGIRPVKIRAKHPKRFAFTMDRELRLLTPENMIEGEAVPDRKFIVFTYGSSDNPFGRGLGQTLWWPVWFKKNAMKFWLIFAEKFGSPTTVGKYPPGTSPEDQQTLFEALQAIQQETGIKIPNTMDIDFLEAQRYGTVNTYESLCDFLDKQVTKRALGQTLTTDVGSTGSLAAGQVHNEVRGDIVKADADILSECLNSSLIRWIVDLNFAGVTEYPEFWIRTDEEQDLKPLAERDQILVNMGLPVANQYCYDTYNVPRPEKGDDLLTPRAAAAIDKSGDGAGPAGELSAGDEEKAEFADRAAQDGPGSTIGGAGDTLDRLGEKAISGADMNPLWAPVEKLLDEAESLEDFRDRLIEAYAEMDDSALAELLAQALTAADLAGRFDA